MPKGQELGFLCCPLQVADARLLSVRKATATTLGGAEHLETTTGRRISIVETKYTR